MEAAAVHGVAGHRGVALCTTQSSAQHVRASRLASPSAFRIVHPSLGTLVQIGREDRRCRPLDLDPLRLVALLDTPDPAPTRRVAHLLHDGAAVDGATGVGLIQEDSPHGQRVPAATGEGGNALLVQPFGDPVHRPVRDEVLEDPPHDGGLHLIDLALAGVRDVAVAVDAGAGRLGELAVAGALCLAAHRALGDLLALHLGNERAGGEDEAADRGVLEPLGHELELRAGLLHLVEEHADVVLVPRQSIDGVRDKDIGLAAAEHRADLLDPLAVEVEAARGVADAGRHAPTSGGGQLKTRALLSVEGGAIPLLCVG